MKSISIVEQWKKHRWSTFHFCSKFIKPFL